MIGKTSHPILFIPDSIRQYIRHSHPELRRRIRQALNDVVDGKEVGKPLTAELEGLRSYRIGRFRIIYRIVDQTRLEIVAIGPRPGIYEMTYRMIQRDSKTIHDR